MKRFIAPYIRPAVAICFALSAATGCAVNKNNDDLTTTKGTKLGPLGNFSRTVDDEIGGPTLVMGRALNNPDARVREGTAAAICEKGETDVTERVLTREDWDVKAGNEGTLRCKQRLQGLTHP
jgi:hypothetical protein